MKKLFRPGSPTIVAVDETEGYDTLSLKGGGCPPVQ